MPDLFAPYAVRGVTLRNRIGVSPMQQYCVPDGAMADWHLVHLGGFAVAGAGLVIGEVTAVEPAGRITPCDTGLWDDCFIPGLARVARFVAAHGATFGLQLGHAGRRGSCRIPWEGGAPLAPGEGAWEVVAPSAIPFQTEYADGPLPRALEIPEIERLERAFAAAAERALRAGVRWLELHAAHGYLLHAFHSPLSNRRTDRYGGSFENRIRFTLETVRAIRGVWPEELPLSVRVSCTEWLPGGWDVDDAVVLAARLRESGADVIACSSGAGKSSRNPASREPGFQVPFAERVRAEAGIATAAVGRITEPEQADEIVRAGRADLVLLARQFLREPRWPQRAAAALDRREAVRLPDMFYAVR